MVSKCKPYFYAKNKGKDGIINMKNVNGYKMNEAIKILKEASLSIEKHRFTIRCEHCTLDIVCGGLFEDHDEAAEVALFTADGTTWHPLDMENADGTIFTLDRPVIRRLPLICLPAFIRQFKSLTDEDMPVVWDAWDTIADFPM